jgi:signal transduction histidine kinase
VAQFEQDIKERQAVITVVFPLPPVRAHAATLIQILANLLGNALKFVAPEVIPQIVLRAWEKAGWVRLSIEDNGPGIAPEYHEKIFRVFERLQSDHSNGTGIGLAIVRKGAERMGGRVGVESGPGRKGSLFWIELEKARPNS